MRLEQKICLRIHSQKRNDRTKTAICTSFLQCAMHQRQKNKGLLHKFGAIAVKGLILQLKGFFSSLEHALRNRSGIHNQSLENGKIHN